MACHVLFCPLSIFYRDVAVAHVVYDMLDNGIRKCIRDIEE